MRFLPGLGLAAALAFTPAIVAPAAYADAKSEAFVETNANRVLKVLNDTSLNDDARSAKFSEFMHQFAHVPTIARRVLGVHGRSLSEADFQKYYKAFEAYSIAVYEVQMDQFRGEAIKVTGSSDIDARRSQVRSLIRSSQSGKDIEVVWDVLQSGDGQSYRVRDVGLNINGSMLWLAQDQQAQFEAFLDRNNGDVSKLVARIEKMTADLEARKRAGGGSTLGQTRARTP
jgi:phospholipid transport system substrate-binding protein